MFRWRLGHRPQSPYAARRRPLRLGAAGFGDLAGFLTAWNLWVYGIAVTATILYAIPTELSYLIGPAAAWLPENHLASTLIVGTIVRAALLSPRSTASNSASGSTTPAASP